jgi:hypothetical protein
MLSNGVNIALLTTNPAGTALMNTLLEKSLLIAPAIGNATPLGYLAGGSNAMAAFIHDPAQSSSLSLPPSITRLSDFSLILLVVDQPETGQAWLEQFRLAGVTLPILLVSSAQSAPLLTPFFDSGQLNGMVGGYPESIAYRQLSMPGSASLWVWDGYQLGILTVIVVLLFGGLLQFFLQRKPSTKDQEESR